MPLCYLHTNIADSDLASGLEERLAECVAHAFNIPVNRLIVNVVPGMRIYRNGTTPACNLTISAIDVFDKERNSGYTEKIMEFLMKELKLQRDRLRHDFCKSGLTCQ